MHAALFNALYFITLRFCGPILRPAFTSRLAMPFSTCFAMSCIYFATLQPPYTRLAPSYTKVLSRSVSIPKE